MPAGASRRRFFATFLASRRSRGARLRRPRSTSPGPCWWPSPRTRRSALLWRGLVVDLHAPAQVAGIVVAHPVREPRERELVRRAWPGTASRGALRCQALAQRFVAPGTAGHQGFCPAFPICSRLCSRATDSPPSLRRGEPQHFSSSSARAPKRLNIFRFDSAVCCCL